MGYFRQTFDFAKDMIDGGDRINYGEACQIGVDTFHAVGMAAFGGAGVSVAFERPVPAAILFAGGVLTEMSAWVNRRNVENFDEKESRRAATA
jgi:hypothetical protein